MGVTLADFHSEGIRPIFKDCLNSAQTLGAISWLHCRWVVIVDGLLAEDLRQDQS
jgi:hypothetical protein